LECWSGAGGLVFVVVLVVGPVLASAEAFKGVQYFKVCDGAGGWSV